MFRIGLVAGSIPGDDESVSFGMIPAALEPVGGGQPPKLVPLRHAAGPGRLRTALSTALGIHPWITLELGCAAVSNKPQCEENTTHALGWLKTGSGGRGKLHPDLYLPLTGWLP